MTPQKAAAKCRKMANSESYATKDIFGDSCDYYFAKGKEEAYLDAAAIIDQINQPQPWPPPESLSECLAFNFLYGLWVSKTKGSKAQWNELIPYADNYTHWLPMPPAPEAQG